MAVNLTDSGMPRSRLTNGGHVGSIVEAVQGTHEGVRQRSTNQTATITAAARAAAQMIATI
jgi:hypothetical protein